VEYRTLGDSGLRVSEICLGTWTTFGGSLDDDAAIALVDSAFELGINFFDTANVYSGGASETVLGRAIRDFGRRDEVVIATKVNGPMRPDANGKGLSRKSILTEVDDSLRRLGTDYIDLYIIHRYDKDTPLEETLETLNDIVRAGKARYIGASSMYAWQFMKAIGIQRANHWATFVSMQDYYNLLYREEEREMLRLCLSEGIGVTPWSPLDRGRLTRPWSDTPVTDRAKNDAFAKRIFAKSVALDKPVVDRVMEVARDHGVPPSQIALAWLLRNPVITSPIIGATKPQHLEDAVGSLSVKLSDAEVARLEELYQPHGATEAFS
jgi:aryl-alcohol dehydrogenase-like predicted oxidoreductase